MWSWESVVGAIVAVIVAGMPALLFLLTITYIHASINSSMYELIESTAKASHSAGQLEGRDEGRKAAAVEAATMRQDATDLAKTLLAEAAEKAHQTIAEAADEALGQQKEL